MEVLQYDKPSDPQFVTAAKHAIVALADSQQLQLIWCSAASEADPLLANVGPLSIVGGWFGIRGLQELLEPERQLNFERARRQYSERSADEGFRSPRELSIIALVDMLPESPVSVIQARTTPPGPMRVLVEKMNEWIAAHRADLEKLAPTGEGVDYSEGACKDGKPVRR